MSLNFKHKHPLTHPLYQSQQILLTIEATVATRTTMATTIANSNNVLTTSRISLGNRTNNTDHAMISSRVAIKLNVKFAVCLVIVLAVVRNFKFLVVLCHLRVTTHRLPTNTRCLLFLGSLVLTLPWRHPHTIPILGFLTVEQLIISPRI